MSETERGSDKPLTDKYPFSVDKERHYNMHRYELGKKFFVNAICIPPVVSLVLKFDGWVIAVHGSDPVVSAASEDTAIAVIEGFKAWVDELPSDPDAVKMWLKMEGFL